jgi:hypothetical protein
MDRERAVRALTGEAVPHPTKDALDFHPYLRKALMRKLRWPRDGSRRPWLVGIPMLGGSAASWQGVGNVVRSWSASSFCTVWQKVQLEKHPQMKHWKSKWVDADKIALDIFYGNVTDPYR